MQKSLLISLLVAFSFTLPSACAHTLIVRLNINNTQNTVYIPGMGEQASGYLGGETSYPVISPYLASYYGGFLNGLAAKNGESLKAGNGSGSHFIQLEQNLTNSRIFLAAAPGDWHAMDNRISLIETGKFLSQVSPSFTFPLGGLYPVRLLLKYPSIDIQGDLILGKGQTRLVIENKGLSGGKPVVEIRKG
jgi:hypothetical protein